MSLTLQALSAIEILDSRGRPTLSVRAVTSAGERVSAGVPSGASTGTKEAVERRDGDPARYGGLGVGQAVEAVNGEIAELLVGRSFPDQPALDAALIELDGMPDKSRLGANALVGVSMAAARAFAAVEGVELWRSLAAGASWHAQVPPRLPVPHLNVVNGGVHAPNELDFQEFMLAPIGAPSFAEALRAGAETYGALRRLLTSRGDQTGLGDEGGFAPQIREPEEVLSLLVQAIEAAGYALGRQGIALAMDPASSELYRDGAYHVAGEALSSDQLIERYVAMAERFPLWLLEDGLAESDWEGWSRLTARLGERLELVGDDIFCTNPALIDEGIRRRTATASLIKLNQIGTVTETLQAMVRCREAGWTQLVSHRSGETDDAFIADLAVATGCGRIKSGAPARGERVAKYNRLLEIEATTDLAYGLG